MSLVATLLKLKEDVNAKAKQKPQQEYTDNENSFRANGNF